MDRSANFFPPGHFDCVVLTAFETEFTSLRNVFGLSGIRMHHAQSVEQADFMLITTGATVLLSDVAVVDGTWRTALDLLYDSHPTVSLVILADAVDEPFVRDAQWSGACGVLWKPLLFEMARKLIRSAHEAAHERRLLIQGVGSGD